jgi:hypothetical protein
VKAQFYSSSTQREFGAAMTQASIPERDPASQEHPPEPAGSARSAPNESPLAHHLVTSTNGDKENELVPDSGDVGICCSGGGIRAAAYAIGCLQVFEAEGVLRGEHRARYISAVSGGSYAVGAAAIIQFGLESAEVCGGDHDDDIDLRPETTRAVPDDLRVEVGPYAPSSPELRHLRDHLRYLTHARGGLRAELWRLFMGILMNVLLFAALAMLVGYLAGWVYGWVFPQLRSDATATSIHPQTRVVDSAVVLGFAALVVGLLWVARRWRRTVRTWQSVALWLLFAAVAWALVALAIPQLLAWLHRATVSGHAHVAEPASGGVRHLWIPLGGFVGVLAAIAGAVGPVWRDLRAVTAKVDGSGFVAKLVRRFKGPLINLLTMLAVPALFGGLLVAFMYSGASEPPFVAGSNGWEWLGVAGPLLLLGLAWVFADLNSWSLHTIYKGRLADAFNLERFVPPEADESRARTAGAPGSAPPHGSGTPSDPVDVRRRTGPLPLSNLRLKRFPEVLICATSNITDYGLVPTGMRAAPFLLSAAWVGGPIVGDCHTRTYEDLGMSEQSNLTVMDAVSISGAAVAPEMGSMTRSPYRFLLTLANIRLGVWIPKPRAVCERLAKRTAKPNRKLRPIPPPGIEHLLNEAFLRDLPNSRFVYVTDGGHYDNLGLVEVLKRQCAWIWCIDASGDQIDTFTTLGSALAIARSDYGIQVDIEPQVMAPDPPDSRFVSQPYCWGTITYPEGTPRHGRLVVVKAGVPTNAPWSVLAFHAGNSDFPCDPTTNQLYDARRFDAYVALGNFAMSQATTAMRDTYRDFLAHADGSTGDGDRDLAALPS